MGQAPLRTSHMQLSASYATPEGLGDVRRANGSVDKITSCGGHDSIGQIASANFQVTANHVRFAPESGHEVSELGCPLCAKLGHYAVQQSIAPIGACTAEFSPVVGAGCKAPAHSHHILPLALSVLPHPARGR